MLEHRPEPREQQPPHKIKLACLRVGDGFYALDIMCIREIIRPLPVTPVPKAPPFIDGIINLRKSVIPVVDLRRRFGLPMQGQDRQQRIIICSVEGRMVGLMVSEVTEVRSCSRDDIQPAPYYLSGEQARLFPGVFQNGERFHMLLDLRGILASDRIIDVQQLQQQSLTDGGVERENL